MRKTPEVIYRPGRPDRQAGPTWEYFSPYLVTQGPDLLFVYYPSYYRTGDIVADVVARNEHDRTSLTGQWASMDFVVWHAMRIMAVIHTPMDDEEGALQVIRFDEEGNSPDYSEPMYGWPTRDEWIAAGRPDRIVLTQEDVDRNIAREDAGKDIRMIPLEDIEGFGPEHETDED